MTSHDTLSGTHTAIFAWIEVFRVQQRRHSTIGMRAPVTYARAAQSAPAA